MARNEMGNIDTNALRERLQAAGQAHLWQHAERLSGPAREALLRRIDGLDLRLVGELAGLATLGSGAAAPRFDPPEVFGLA